jgi:hypothetical protein
MAHLTFIAKERSAASFQLAGRVVLAKTRSMGLALFGDDSLT